MRVSFCCNHEQNGVFAGRLTGIECGGITMFLWIFASIDDPACEDGVPFEVHDNGVVIGWRWFPIVPGTYHEWVGNWCWNEACMEQADAWRAVQYVAYLGGDIESAPEKIWRRLGKERKVAGWA